MQIRCHNCHKPFAIGKQEIHTALDIMASQNLNHYDAPCPHCRRVNRISFRELERSMPDWKPGAAGESEAE
jgi:phage FluMu protein Com